MDDFVKDPSIKHFIMVTIDEFLEKYEPGDPKYKPDVLKQMSEMKERREKIIEQHKKEHDESKQKMNSIVNNSKNIDYSNKFQEQTSLILELMRENRELKDFSFSVISG